VPTLATTPNTAAITQHIIDLNDMTAPQASMGIAQLQVRRRGRRPTVYAHVLPRPNVLFVDAEPLKLAIQTEALPHRLCRRDRVSLSGGGDGENVGATRL
jgi:hypothetical protein